MLSDSNIAKINALIAQELREADRFINTPEDKMNALNRVAKLQTLLSEQMIPQPVDLDQLADVIIAKLTKPSTPKPPSILSVLVDAYARR